MSHFSNTTHGLPLNGNPTNYCLDIGTPRYPAATNYDRVVFNARVDANAAPQPRGIPLLSLVEEGGERLEAASDTPFESTPVSEADRIEIEFHWPGYMRFAVYVTIASSTNYGHGHVLRQHSSRSYLAQKIAEHAVRYFRMAQCESNVPSPVPIGTTSTPGVTPGDLLLRSLVPMINPEGRLVWVPHFAARYPLGEGYMSRNCQRTRW